MAGWIIPPPRAPAKSAAAHARERQRKVRALEARGLLRSPRIKAALLKVRREDFIPREYRDYAYEEVPLPLPGTAATISCPHSYPLFYEPLGLGRGHRFLEIGTGSGYGAAVAREIVGGEGRVVSIEIDPLTQEFARRNLERAGYGDVLLVLGDGWLGYPAAAPYDCIAVTAACPGMPAPLIAQLAPGGRAIALRRAAQKASRPMKEIEIYRDPSSRRLGFQVREDRKLVWNEVSSDTDIRKLRRHLRHAYGRSVRLSGLAG